MTIVKGRVEEIKYLKMERNTLENNAFLIGYIEIDTSQKIGLLRQQMREEIVTIIEGVNASLEIDFKYYHQDNIYFNYPHSFSDCILDAYQYGSGWTIVPRPERFDEITTTLSHKLDVNFKEYSYDDLKKMTAGDWAPPPYIRPFNLPVEMSSDWLILNIRRKFNVIVPREKVH